MRVQEKSSETCAKMTEEMSMNGGPDVPSGSKRCLGAGNAEDCIDTSPSCTVATDSNKSTSVAGGRLKFFKDGKFILELSHRKEGERTSWVPVPKKTYWPPPGAAGTPRQESSTSLSVSDDNSSVQSSPWQRDHCWKQSSPRHGINKEMAFLMRPSHHVMYIRNLSYFSRVIRRKRRCPYKSIHINIVDSVDTNTVKVVKGQKRTASENANKLTSIVQTLLEKVRGPGNSESVACSSVVNHATAANLCNTSRLDPSIVSPRKRILREMERVSLEDFANSKRQRARPGATSQQSHSADNGSGTVTCHTQTLPSPPAPKSNVTNYSITSLLGQTDEPAATPPGHETEPSFLRTLLKSPPSPTPSPRSRSSASRRASPSPVPSPPGLRNVPSVPPFLPPHLLYAPPYLPPHNHPYYPTIPPSHPPPLWLHYPLSSLPRDAIYPGLVHPPPISWGPPITHQPMTDIKRDDTGSDVPLNLSKHAG